MQTYLHTVLVSLVTALAAEPAGACIVKARLKLDDVKYASTVVVGRIVDYEIVLDQTVRKERREMLERAANKTTESWRLDSEQKSFLSDYARFKVLVDKVLVGRPPKVVSVAWRNSTFGEPETMKEGPYVIALRKADSMIPARRGPSASILPSPELKSLTVLQAPCAPAFLFEAQSAEAKAIQQILTENQTTAR